MRFLKAAETLSLRRSGLLTWKASGGDPAFIFDVPQNEIGFVCFLVIGLHGHLAPALCIDEGLGFSDLKIISLKSFPISFYHVPIRNYTRIYRILFRLSGKSGAFRFIAFWTKSAVTVAVLHYVFNLRYQNIGVFSPSVSPAGEKSTLKANIKRIVKFFSDVMKGEGVRIQADVQSSLQMLRLHMSLAAQPVEIRMKELLAAIPGVEPLISFIVPTYNTNVTYLNDLLNSFKIQNADYAELILSDDGSTKVETLAWLKEARSVPKVTVILNAENRGIAAATNAGVEVAKGTWISFIDHDDQFTPSAVAVIADAITQYPDADLFYTDEIITDEALQPLDVFCKPAFDSVLLSGMNYINHFSVYRHSQLAAIGYLRGDRDGSQDYDLLLRYLSQCKTKLVIHIPFPAYMWRRDERTYSHVNIEKSVFNARQAIADAYRSKYESVEVFPALDANLHRISFGTKRRPTISVILPNRDSFQLIARIIDDLLHHTIYPALEIIIVDNGSRDENVLLFYDKLIQDIDLITIEIKEEAFNFADMCNRGARLAKGELLLLLNNDIEVMEPHWLDEMVNCLNYDNVGVVGAKLLYPDGTIQHNGVIVGLSDAAGHWYVGDVSDVAGPMGRFRVRQTMTAVTGACMLVTRACFDRVGGMDAINFPISYNDIDFCLRARQKGFRTIWTPFAQLIHHESVTRGSDETGENNIRFKAEFARLQERHGTAGYIDDAYSPFYDRRYSVPHLIVPPVLPSLRLNFFS
jgi:GT2 family glycosyltransferase